MSSSSQSLPAAPIIKAYAQAIRPALSFILISTVFGAMLLPLLILLFALSTPKTRRRPIFILNVLSVSLGITTAALSAHLAIMVILFPFVQGNITEHIIYTVLDLWTPWIAEAVLVVRIAAVFPRRKWPQLLAFPIAVKAARIVFTVIFFIRWGKMILRGLSNEYDILGTFRMEFKVLFCLELLDNTYASFIFLWRLNHQRRDSTPIARLSSSNSNETSYTRKLQTLFWIASTNFIFPLVFGVAQIITVFVGNDMTVPVGINMINISVAIISTVFATIWSCTLSFKDAISQTDSVPSPSTRVVFRTGGMSMGTTSSDTSNNAKEVNWGKSYTAA
ncbi:hypothetical protein C8J57DRAFT_687390 [Mycena rebaudengoi]|nr:hypothetical protein C8J57DRAFT_687390 [Mycena rebaudengoi]